MDPIARQTAEELLDHPVFGGFRDWFQPELEVRQCSRILSLSSP